MVSSFMTQISAFYIFSFWRAQEKFSKDLQDQGETLSGSVVTRQGVDIDKGRLILIN